MARRITNRELAKREISRLAKGIKRNKRKGYIYSDNALPELPKRVTAKFLNNLKNIKPLDLAVSDVYIKQDNVIVHKKTGEVLPQNENRDIYDIAGIKPEVLESYFDEKQVINGVIGYFNGNAESIGGKLGKWLKDWLNDLISEYGEVSVAQMLIDSPEFEMIYEYMSRRGYSSAQNFEEYCSAMMKYMPKLSPAHIELCEKIFDGMANEENTI